MKKKTFTDLNFKPLPVDYIYLEDLCIVLNIELEEIKKYLLKHKIKLYEKKEDLKHIDFHVFKIINANNKFLNFQIEEYSQQNKYIVSKEYISYIDSQKIVNILNLSKLKNNNIQNNIIDSNIGEKKLNSENENKSNYDDIVSEYAELLKLNKKLETKITDFKQKNKELQDEVNNLKNEVNELRELHIKKTYTEKRENTVKTIIKLCFEIAEATGSKKYTQKKLYEKIYNDSKTDILDAYVNIFWKTLPEKYKHGPGRPPKENSKNPTE
jgi:hypothetical protein